MKIFIAGGTGRVAQYVIRILAERGHEISAGCRNPEKIAESENVHPVAFDLHMPVDDMKPFLKDMDAVYFLAGSRGKDLLQTDAFGAVKLMEAAEGVQLKRYIMLSSLFSMNPTKWTQEPGLAEITDYNIAKFFADQWLVRDTNLDYTIVQASLLAEEPGTGKIQIRPQHESKNAIPDVALVLADVLEMPNTIRKIIPIGVGDTAIEEALNSI